MQTKHLKALDQSNLTIDHKFQQVLRDYLFKENNMAAVKNTKQIHIKDLFKQQAFIGTVAAAFILIVGVSAYAMNAKSSSQAHQSDAEEIKAAVELPNNLSGVLSIEEIRAKAAADIPDGATISGIELENEHGQLVFKVKFSDGSFRLYNATDGSLVLKLEDEADDDLDEDDSVPAGFVAGITIEQARTIAANNRPGETITKIELETENGVVVYSVRFSDGGRVDVNATDGSVVRIKPGETSGSGSSKTEDDHSSDDSHESGETENGSGSGSSH